MSRNVIHELLKRPIAYQPTIAKAFGSVKLAILWSQLYYWSDKSKDPYGWIYKTRDELYEETGLKRREQETARTLGKKLGIIEEKKAGSPPVIHFRVDIEKTAEVLEEYMQDVEVKPKKKPAKKKKKEQKTDGALINKVIEAFAEVNPSYDRLFAQTPQRQAVDRMAQKFGIEKLEAMVLFLPKVNASKYSGLSITTPYQLEANLGKLKAWADKQKDTSGNKGKEILVA